jgi:hypothetical protein
MPKIRKKIKEITGYDSNNDPIYKIKSGILTKNFKKILSEEDSKQDSIPSKKETTGKAFQDFNQKFDDSKSIVISNKEVNHVFGIESSYKSEKNKVLHTPNTFDDENTFNITKDTNFSMYDSVLYKNNFELQYEPYKENNFNLNNTSTSYTSPFENIQNTEFDVENYNLSNQVEIDIELSFDTPAILQNNRMYFRDAANNQNYLEANKIGFSNDKFLAQNSPVAYFNFKNNRWDYIRNSIDENGNEYLYPSVSLNTVVDESTFSDVISHGNLAFGPGYSNDSDNKSLGLPNFNSKFPIGDQWYTEDDTLLNMSNYITGDFILEKIVFESNKNQHILEKNNYVLFDINDNEFNNISQNNYNQNFDHITNVFNFFILKQTVKSFNPISYWEGSGLESDKRYINNLYFEKQNNDPNTSLNTKSSIINDYIGERNIYKFNYSQDLNTINTENIISKSSKREIVSVSSCLIYSENISNQDTNIEQNMISLSNENYFDFKINTDSLDNLNFLNEGIKFGSFVKTPNVTNIFSKHIIYDKYTQLSSEIFSSNYFGERDLQGNYNERSLRNKRNETFIKSDILTNRNNLVLNELKEKYYNSPYILKPSDKLIFGISAYTNGNILPYIFKLEDKVNIKLIGRHVLNKVKKPIKTQNVLTSKSIKKEISHEVYDEWKTNKIEDLFDGFYDNIYNNEDTSTTQSNILDREIYGKLSSKQFGSFSNTVKLFDNKNNVIYDTVMPSTLKYYRTSGNFSDSITFNNIRLSYESDSNFDNENYQWINSYPFETRFESIFNNRDENINLEREGIEKFFIKVEKYLLSGECYQYYKIDKKFGEYPNTVFKNIRGYIETETLSDEGSLYYLEQGESKSTAIPTNVYADIYIIGDNTPYIVKLKGDIFDINPNILGEGTMPDTLNANPGRLVFYNPNIETDSDETFNFKNENSPNDTRQKFLPFKVIARLGSSQSKSDKSNIASNFNSIYDIFWVKPDSQDMSNFAYSKSQDSNYAEFGYYPYMENEIYLMNFSGYKPNDFKKEDSVDNLNKVFFGFTNIKGKSYRYYPLSRHDGWKYGIYNSKQTGLSYNFSWNSYGQFKDKYYGSTNTAIYKKDNQVEWPIVKKFINSFYYPVNNQDSSITTTYNKDYYARSSHPYIEDSTNTLSQYYTS